MTFKTILSSVFASIVVTLLLNYIDVKFGVKSAIIAGLVLILLCVLGVSIWENMTIRN